MIINEIFYSLQGEGALAGLPSVFVRLAGCPLRCRWCDTKYAWHNSAGQELTIDAIKQKVHACQGTHVVITGGEPITNPSLTDLIDALAQSAGHITIETSGIKFVPNLKCDLMSISPKLSNSTPAEPDLAVEHERIRLNLSSLQKLIDNYNCQLKFVVDTCADFTEIDDCLAKLKNISPDRVFLMPQATTPRQYIEKSKMLVEFCKQTGFALSARLQVLLWPNQPGR